MKKLYGTIVAMTTPLDAAGNLDFVSLDRQVDFLLESGVNCLYPLGSTGECHLMSEKERRNLAERVVNRVNGRIIVYIHVGAYSTEATMRLAVHAKKIGADGIGCVAPYYYKHSDSELFEHFRAISQALPEDFPLYLYNIPQLSGNDLTPYLVKRIVKECPNYVGIKYSVPDLRRFTQYRCVNNENFSVLAGSDDMAWPFYLAGAKGIVTGSSMLCPGIFVDLFNAWQEKDMVLCEQLDKLIRELVWLIDGRFASIKFGLQYLGVINCDRMKRPYMELKDEDKKAFISVYENLLKRYQSVRSC